MHRFTWITYMHLAVVIQSVIYLITNFFTVIQHFYYTDVTMSPMASQITSLGIVYSTVYSGADQSKHQSSASLAFVRRIHWGPVNSPHKRPVTRKMFPSDDVIMYWNIFIIHVCFIGSQSVSHFIYLSDFFIILTHCLQENLVYICK